MKKVLSTNEFFQNYYIFLIINLAVSIFFEIPLLMWITALGYIILLIMFIIHKKYAGINLPSKCKRNIFGLIEIHVEKDCDGKVKNLLRIVYEAILVGKKENRDILFDSGLFKKDNIIKYFGDSVDFLLYGNSQGFSNRFNKLLFKPRFSKIEPLRCRIMIQKLTCEQIKIIENKVKQLEQRSNRRQ